MKNLIDNETGMLVLIPESIEDKRLLYHLMNAIDIRDFTNYIKFYDLEKEPMSSDLGVTVEQFDNYLASETEPDININRFSQILIKNEKDNKTGLLIGFNRNSSMDGNT